jgi:hypothetical protein
MLVLGLVQWWYGQGWLTAAKRLKGRLSAHFQAFSVPLLLQTLFAPWKQIVAAKNPNATIGEKLRGVLDNLVSRFIGFCVRMLTLFASLLLGIVIAVGGLVLLVLWPFIPVISIALLFRGLGLW